MDCPARALWSTVPFMLLLACATGADDADDGGGFGVSTPPVLTSPAGSTGADTTTTDRPTTGDTTGRDPTTGPPGTTTEIGETGPVDPTTTGAIDSTGEGDESSTGPVVLCGNGTIDAPEECDGADLGAMSCATLGFTGGALTCTPQCIFDKSKCTSPSCGDGKVDPGEECDCGDQGTNCTAAQLGNAMCTSLPSPVGGNYNAGTLACNSPGSCSFNKAACTYCGDNVKNGAEPCDGPDLAGRTCQTQGFSNGTLTCSACGLNTAGCTKCGNGVVDGGELCDGGNFNGQSCNSVDPGKFAGGNLGCSGACNAISTDACNSGNCCAAANAPFCQVAGIEDCVCAFDSYCCVTAWDPQCVNEAIAQCGAKC